MFVVLVVFECAKSLLGGGPGRKVKAMSEIIK